MRVASVAEALAKSAREIPRVTPYEGFSQEEWQEFVALSEELWRRSDSLAKKARERPPHQLHASIAAVEATCDKCHTRFVPGGVAPGR